jgi:hypothetical protein
LSRTIEATFQPNFSIGLDIAEHLVSNWVNSRKKIGLDVCKMVKEHEITIKV